MDQKFQQPSPELLAPGGTLDKAKLALQYGADAVYCGTNIFALRQHAGNFNYETLREIVEYAHSMNKKVYVTVNVFAHNSHIKVIERALKELQTIKPDALIISDAGVVSLVKEHAPDLAIHISTQASVTNALGVKFWADQGAERVILARELNIREVKEIHEQYPDIEIETFVHGAQCMAYSGRCMLAAYQTDSRKANSGSCCNSCRWSYKDVDAVPDPDEGSTYEDIPTDAEHVTVKHVVEAQRPDEVLTVEQDEFGTYIFNADDMCMVEHVNELADAGIISLKVEGRGRSPFYVARVVKAYREAIDMIGDTSGTAKARLAELKLQLKRSNNRNFDTGFFFGPPRQSRDNNKGELTDKLVGEYLETVDEHTVRMLVKNEIYQGETINILTPDDEYSVTLDKIIDAKTGNEIASAHGGKKDEILVTLPKPVNEHMIAWIDVSTREDNSQGIRQATQN